jgi:CcmD family protein
MSYVIAAYGVTGLTLVLYWLHLSRERRSLRRR